MAKQLNQYDNTEQKIFCGMLAYLMLKNGYKVESVAKAISVPVSFVQHMANDGMKNGVFPVGDKICQKVFRSPRLDKVDFLACFRRILSPETPADIFCGCYGMSTAELFWAEYYIQTYRDCDPLDLMEDRVPKAIRNPVKTFVESRCIVGKEQSCNVREIYSKFEKFVQRVGAKQVSIQAFSKRIKHLIPTVQTSVYRDGEKFARKYVGIGLK